MAKKEIFVFTGGAQRGPYSIGEVQQQIAAGDCDPTSLAWKEGMADWKPVSSLPELATVADEGVSDEPSLPLAPQDGAPPAVPATASVGHPTQANQLNQPGVTQTNGLAVASLILGCLSLASLIVIACFAIVLAIPAVILGHSALSQIRRQPGRYEGRGLAIGGLWTGYICLSLSILLPLLLLGGVAAFGAFGN